MQVRNLDSLINAKCREKTELEKQVMCLQSVKLGDKVKTSITDSTQKTIDKIIDIENEIDNEIDNLVNLKAEVRQYINQLSDNRYITVLTDYYINNMTFDEIAEDNKIRYSKRQIMRIYGNALQAFERKFNLL